VGALTHSLGCTVSMDLTTETHPPTGVLELIGPLGFGVWSGPLPRIDSTTWPPMRTFRAYSKRAHWKEQLIKVLQIHRAIACSPLALKMYADVLRANIESNKLKEPRYIMQTDECIVCAEVEQAARTIKTLVSSAGLTPRLEYHIIQ
jgi:hypothetical protein